MSDVSVWSDCSAIYGPCFFGADEPGYLAFRAGRVLHGVGLVLGAVVPAVVEVGEGGHGLLVDTTAVAVDFGDAVVIDGGEV